MRADEKKQAAVFFRSRFLIIFVGCLWALGSGAQDMVAYDTAVANMTDLGDLARKILKKKVDTTKASKPPGMALLPSFGYNPSFGFVIGAKASAIKQFGQPENTHLSAFGLEALITSKGIITGQARHNVFTAGNRFNFQGNWQLSKFLITDYSIGTGNKDYLTNSDSAFLLKFTYIRLAERTYKRIGRNLYVGVGVNFNIRSKINDEKLDSLGTTPHNRYSIRNGFSPKKYSANGMLLALEYNTRDHPIRAYRGTYAEWGLLFNQKWLGSSETSILLLYDLRKYISLSTKKPSHVLAFWHLGSYTLSGKVPYLALPATGYDTYNRSGRAYTIGRFKGPNFAYFESEYRFPITANGLLSGVAFVNLQTASDDLGKKIFQFWDPGGGGGLRILLQKHSRSTLCIDYAKGKYGSGGLFFGLNEVF